VGRTGCNGEMEAIGDGLIDCSVESYRLASTKTHVGNGALVGSSTCRSEFSPGSGSLGFGVVQGPLYTADDVGHASAAVGPEDLYRDDMCTLSNTILAGGDGASAVRSMAISVFVHVVERNGLAPRGTTLEFHMMDVNAGVNDIDVDTVASIGIVFVFGECRNGQLGTVTYTS
jgi:hypothetical protein